MKLTDNELRALHVQARAAMLKTACTVSQVIPAFSPLYIQAILEARRANATPFGYVCLYPSINGPIWRTDTSNCGISGPQPTEYCALFIDPPLANLTQAERDVIDERRRQICEEGFTTECDDENDAGDLAAAGAAYALNAACQLNPSDVPPLDHVPAMWPLGWDFKWWKPKTPILDLKRAAALMIAELDRAYRASADATAMREPVPGRRDADNASLGTTQDINNPAI